MTTPSTPPASEPATLRRAEALYDLERYEQAAALTARHLAQHPDDAPALALLARCRRHLGDRAEALRLADEALRADPGLPSAWFLRADLLAHGPAGGPQWAAAEDAARRGLALVPHHWSGYHVLGTILARSDAPARRGEAYALALRSVELGPEEDATHFLLGLTAYRLKDYRTAERAYENALRLNPQSSEAHNNLSLLHLRRRWFTRGAWTRAAEGFVDSAALDLDDREARFNLETMAWGTAAGARWVALGGFMAAGIGSAQLRGGGTGTGPVVAEVVGVAAFLALWGGWVLWMGRRVPPRLRRPMLLISRTCPPVLWMAGAVGLLGLHSLATLALPTLDGGVVAGFGGPLFWAVVITYWVSRSALKRRAPGRR
ncbi:tetratricopeptide repeat protein [Streptomyces sp. WAC05374]|uniref:tetratricopeptide repeat protein n=1 Tax=Streptomyces sp. WAC05374 TaxID=2487420 RepID=UPI000F86DA68|nr:tetratricopeptide repeat protein [Streptomyces sp. WAC05374]RST05751.1 tetratricopeptide repeat protein [Streptomyces sp. WAC05374]TDF45311.1 tetratricopeptide repeat protein [Streptomyces sp. WAC05374]TDF55701.1 tetratricopeptide repeat protein [Streptomyces sp. WAC05374]TDF58839.1 tetratricopeptide repeat protein [Streptomyces sp. WAC05374]